MIIDKRVMLLYNENIIRFILYKNSGLERSY